MPTKINHKGHSEVEGEAERESHKEKGKIAHDGGRDKERDYMPSKMSK